MPRKCLSFHLLRFHCSLHCSECCQLQAQAQKLAADASKPVHLPPGKDLVSCDFGLKGESRINLILASGGPAGLKLCIDFRWEDGEPVKSCLEAPDRWQTQAAERVTIEIAPDKLVTVQQQVVTSSAVLVMYCVKCPKHTCTHIVQ